MKRIILQHVWGIGGSDIRRKFSYLFSVHKNELTEVEYHRNSMDFAKEESEKNDYVPALALVMKYLHAHPNEEIVIDDKTSEILRPELEIIVNSHNYAIAKYNKSCK